MESVPKAHVEWYTKEERDRLLEGMFRLEPQWYLFYYLTVRLGLRTGEVYAVSHRQIRKEPPKLLVDQAVQRGTKKREATLVTRKNDEAYELDLTADILAAVDWHVAEGYAGKEFLFSKAGDSPATSTATSCRSSSCSKSSASDCSAITRLAGIR